MGKVIITSVIEAFLLFLGYISTSYLLAFCIFGGNDFAEVFFFLFFIFTFLVFWMLFGIINQLKELNERLAGVSKDKTSSTVEKEDT